VSYSLTAIVSKVRERLAWLLANLTPDLAAAQAFVDIDAEDDDGEHDESPLEAITEPRRLRLFEVVAFSPKARMPWGSQYATYEHGIAIRVGYSLQRTEEIGDVTYKVQDLKDADFRQIDWLVQAGAPFSEQDDDHPAIPGVHLALLGDAVEEAGGRVRTIRYGIELEEEHS
jgi:hypothetical protein